MKNVLNSFLEIKFYQYDKDKLSGEEITNFRNAIFDYKKLFDKYKYIFDELERSLKIAYGIFQNKVDFSNIYHFRYLIFRYAENFDYKIVSNLNEIVEYKYISFSKEYAEELFKAYAKFEIELFNILDLNIKEVLLNSVKISEDDLEKVDNKDKLYEYDEDEKKLLKYSIPDEGGYFYVKEISFNFDITIYETSLTLLLDNKTKFQKEIIFNYFPHKLI